LVQLLGLTLLLLLLLLLLPALQESIRRLKPSHDNSRPNGTDGLLPFLGWYMNTAQSCTWFVHDNALEPMLGSGCRTAEE